MVRVRVSSANLGDDIRDSVRRGVRTSSGDIDAEGNKAGRQFSEGVGDGVRDSRSVTDRAARESAQSMNRETVRQHNRDRPVLRNLFGSTGSDISDSLSHNFNLGIGAARMGKGVIGALTLAGPSILAGAGQLGTAMAGEIVNAMAAIGPGLAGAVGVGLATVSTAALNFGLLLAAFKASGKTLETVTKRLSETAELIGTPIAEGMLSGLNDMVDSLQSSLPELNDLLRTTGERFGDVARGIGTVLTSGANMGRIRTILETNNTFIDNFGRGINGLTSSFLILFAAAKPFVDYIGQGLAKFGEWAETTLSAAEANGTLAAWMDRMLEKFQQLWQAVKDFGAGFKNIFDAASATGETLMTRIADIGARFREWTGDEANQARMTTFFEKAHTLSSAIWEMIGKIAVAWGNAFTNSDLTPILTVFTTISDVIAPAIARIFNQIQAGAGANLVLIVENIGDIFTRIADSGVIQTVASHVSAFVLAITELIDTDIGGQIAALGLSFLLFGGIISAFIGPVITLGTALAGLSAPLLLIVGIAAAVAGAFALIWANSEPFRTSIQELGALLAGRFSQIWAELSPKLEVFWGKLQKLAGIIGDKLAPIIERFGPIIADAFGVIGSIVGTVVEQVGNFFDLISALISGDWSAMWEAFKNIIATAWNGVISIISGVWSVITGLVAAIWAGVVNVVIWAWNSIWAAVEAGVTFVLDKIREFGNWIQEIWTGIYNWVTTKWGELWTWVGERLSAAWEWIKTTLSDAYNAVVEGITGFGNMIQEVWNNFWTWVGERLSAAWDGMIAFLQGAWNTVTEGIRSFGTWIQEIWNATWTAVGDFIRSVWDSITSWLSARWEDIKSVASSVWNSIVGVASSAWESVTSTIRGVVETVVGWLSERWEDIKSGVSSAWDGLKGIVSGIWEGIKEAIMAPIRSAWEWLQGVFDDIKSAVAGVVDAVSGAFDEVAATYAQMQATQQAADAASAGFGASTGIMGTPTFAGNSDGIFGLAKGGIVAPVPGGRQFVIGEGRRPERVEPLNANGLSSRDEALISSIVRSMAPAGGGSTRTLVEVSIGERGLDAEIRRVVTETQSEMARRIANRKVRPA